MEIRHLKLVKAVAEHGTLTRASQALYLSQSALSHQLREIESQCGGQVFHRVNRRMVLTPLGQRVYEMADSVLKEMECGDMDIKRMITGENLNLRISMQCYTFYHWLSKVLLEYKQRFPKVDVQVITEATYEAIDWLEAGKLDMAIAHYLPENPHFHYDELLEDELVAIVHRNHPLASRNYVDPADLDGMTYVTYATPEGYIGKTYKQVFLAHDVAPKKTIRADHTETIVESVKANLGFSILARWALAPYADCPQITVLSITKRGIHRKWYAATAKYKERPEYINAFIRVMQGIHLTASS